LSDLLSAGWPISSRVRRCNISLRQVPTPLRGARTAADGATLPYPALRDR
jgi:hypothetical protein